MKPFDFNKYLKNNPLLKEIEGLDDFVSGVSSNSLVKGKGYILATDQENYGFEMNDEIRAILKKYGADENNFVIYGQVPFDDLAGDQLIDLESDNAVKIEKRK
jgi:hypothetical protein